MAGYVVNTGDNYEGRSLYVFIEEMGFDQGRQAMWLRWHLKGCGGNTAWWYRMGPIRLWVNGQYVYGYEARTEVYAEQELAAGDFEVIFNRYASAPVTVSFEAAVFLYNINVRGSGTVYINPPIQAPIINNVNCNNITYNSAELTANVDYRGNSIILQRGWDISTNKGQNWVNYDISNTADNGYYKATNLTPNTTYWYRMYLRVVMNPNEYYHSAWTEFKTSAAAQCSLPSNNITIGDIIKVTKINPLKHSIQMVIKINDTTILTKNLTTSEGEENVTLNTTQQNQIYQLCVNDIKINGQISFKDVEANITTTNNVIFNIPINSSTNPTIAPITMEETNAKALNLNLPNQLFVNQFSTIKISWAWNQMQAKKYATLKTLELTYFKNIWRITVPENPPQNGEISIAVRDPNLLQTFEIKLTDSRGLETIQTYSVNTIYYEPLQLMHIEGSRLNEFEPVTSVDATFLLGSGGESINECHNRITDVKYRYKTDFGNWSDWVILNPNEGELTTTDHPKQFKYKIPPIATNLSNDNAYTIELYVKDMLYEYTAVQKIQEGIPTMFICSDAKTAFLGKDEIATFNKVYPVGCIYLSINDTNPSNLFGLGEWELISQGRTLVGVDQSNNKFNAPQKTGGVLENVIEERNLPPSAFVRENRAAGAGNKNWSAPIEGWANYENGYLNDAPTGVPLDNLQPFYTCYIWCRTA